MAADSLMAGVVRQRYLPVKKVVQLPPADVVHLMFVVIRAITKGTVVVLEPYGSFHAGMVHGVGVVVVASADQVSASVALRYRRFQAELEASARPRLPGATALLKSPAVPHPPDRVRSSGVYFTR